jgi:hypothetical protein
MFGFVQRLGRDSQARWRGIGGPGSRAGTERRSRSTARAPRRNQRLNCEALEGRQMLSGLYIVNASSGKVLDDPDFSTSNGTLIQQYQLNGGLNQQWKLVALADGNDEIFNASSGKVLDEAEISTSNGTLIQQHQLNGGLNQQWSISPFANPVASVPYSPAPASAPLFHNGEPSYLDVEQGYLGDCWLMAGLAEVAARDPQVIKSMFTYDGTTVDNGSKVGLYTVRFFNSSEAAVYVKVDTELPDGGQYCAFVDNALGTQALWVALAEKAYAEANALGYVTTGAEGQDSYGALNGGWPAWSLQAITGEPATRYSTNPTNIASAWKAGDLIVLDTGDPTSSAIVGDHCYAVVGYNASSGKPFQVFNPWGTNSSGYVPGYPQYYGLFPANAAFISQNFTGQTIGVEAMNGDAIDRAFDELTELAPFGGVSDPSGMIHSTRHDRTGSLGGMQASSSYCPGIRIAIS